VSIAPNAIQFLFYYIQALHAIIISTERDILFQQFLHWHGDLGIAFDELPVVPCMSQGNAQWFNTSRCFQIQKHCNFHGVHHQSLFNTHKTHSRMASIRMPNHHKLPLIVCMVFFLAEFPHQMLRLSKIKSTTCCWLEISRYFWIVFASFSILV